MQSIFSFYTYLSFERSNAAWTMVYMEKNTMCVCFCVCVCECVCMCVCVCVCVCVYFIPQRLRVGVWEWNLLFPSFTNAEVTCTSKIHLSCPKFRLYGHFWFTTIFWLKKVTKFFHNFCNEWRFFTEKKSYSEWKEAILVDRKGW